MILVNVRHSKFCAVCYFVYIINKCILKVIFTIFFEMSRKPIFSVGSMNDQMTGGLQTVKDYQKQYPEFDKNFLNPVYNT